MFKLLLINASPSLPRASEPALKKSHFSGELAALALHPDHSLSLGWLYQETKTRTMANLSCLQGCVSGARTPVCDWGWLHSCSTSKLS